VKVAVTGASGFLGRYVIAELRRRAVPVVAVVRPNRDVPPWLTGLSTARIDVHGPSEAAFDALGRPGLVIHLAWGGLPNYQSPHHYESELPAQYRFLKALVEAGLERVVVSGTCLEYGMQPGALSEDLEARPANPYAFAKDALRRELEFLRARCSFALTWARVFYLYGEGQGENSLYAQLRRAVDQGDRAFDMSGGEQLRDYLPAGAAARLLVDLALTPSAHGVVNVCSGRPVSVRCLVEELIRQNGWPIALNLGRYPYPDHEPMAFWGSRTKLDACLAPAPPQG
jgi:nucleoside-diphosphate-sugar epimerase